MNRIYNLIFRRFLGALKALAAFAQFFGGRGGNAAGSASIARGAAGTAASVANSIAMKYPAFIARVCRIGLLAIGSLCHGHVFAAVPSIDLAMATATQWAALTDTSSADRMWNSSSPVMQKNISEDEWETYLSRIHVALGSATDREWSQAVRVSNPPNLRAGEYLNIVYVTRFERGLVIEKVSLLPKVGGWTPVRYVVNPVRQGPNAAAPVK